MKFFLLAMALCSAALCPSAQAQTRITPQFVVDRILGEGRESKSIQLDAQSAYTDYYNTYALYDLSFVSSLGYEESRIAYLSGGGNLEDRNTVWSAAVQKRVPTGTLIDLSYNRTQQNSTFRPSITQGLRTPYAVYDVATIRLTQDLLGNFFGFAERQRLRAADQALESAELLKKEKQEGLVLDSLKLFWDTYVARESLREAVSQRDKYEALVKEVENKSRLGFSSPGDLPKARAEYGAQIRNVKESSFNYLSALDTLLTAMRMGDADRDVSFDLKEELPPLPTMVMPQVDELRSVSVYRNLYEAAELTKKATTLSASVPELKLVGEAGYTGLDERRDRAFSAVTGADKPRYLVQLELSYKFFSSGRAAELNSAGVAYERAYNTLEQTKEKLRQDVSTAMERVRFTYAAATSAIEEMKQWEAAVKAQESSYRQGRLDFSQLITDYNSYFKARATRIRAIGDYHIALHSYAAAVDELVK